MDNRFFSLIVVPDNGNGVRYSSFNSQFLIILFGVLCIAFFICLFFIVGYHMKLRQEKNYRSAVEKRQELLSKIRKSENLLSTLSGKLKEIQKNDNAYRLYVSMDVLDPEMYKAGVGGYKIFDETSYPDINQELLQRLKRISYGVTSIVHQADAEKVSMDQIQGKVHEKIDRMNNTPSIWPTRSPYLTINSPFGYRTNPITGLHQFHDAVDIAGRRGDTVVAAAQGTVVFAGWNGAYGQCVIIRHKYDYETTYGHLDRILVSEGQTVERNQEIGKMGSTGRASGVHLHYMVTCHGQKENPKMFFNF
jgi:murein DD-endopeptidase MepM/ murein hydrolase activator NlpD